jgi:prepilin-type N-terminal cleavage/methylation domain-containing protein
MKKIEAQRSAVGNLRAFTLVEMLVVIAIIGILAGILLPVLAAAKINAQKNVAKLEMRALVTAIQGYDQDYSRFPASVGAQNAATAGGADFTYGGVITAKDGSTSTIQNPAGYGAYQTVNNAELIAILMDNTSVAVNANHQKNPRQVKYLNPTVVSDATLPGVGPDLVYRDPWGNPYIISMDLNYNGVCEDAFYSLDNVSGGGLYGLTQQGGVGPDHWGSHSTVMIWSAGPDRKVDPTIKANTGVNKDNVISWQN